MAWERAPTGERLPLANRYGLQPGSSGFRSAAGAAQLSEERLVTREQISQRWQDQLQQWVAQKLARGEVDILGEAMPEFERIMLNTALQHTHGHKQEAARLLGWGRIILHEKAQRAGYVNPHRGQQAPMFYLKTLAFNSSRHPDRIFLCIT